MGHFHGQGGPDDLAPARCLHLLKRPGRKPSSLVFRFRGTGSSPARWYHDFDFAPPVQALLAQWWFHLAAPPGLSPARWCFDFAPPIQSLLPGVHVFLRQRFKPFSLVFRFCSIGSSPARWYFDVAAQRAGAAGRSGDQTAHDICCFRLLKELQHGLALAATQVLLRSRNGFIPASPGLRLLYLAFSSHLRFRGSACRCRWFIPPSRRPSQLAFSLIAYAGRPTSVSPPSRSFSTALL